MPFRIIRNDITKVRADAIVNTANPYPTYGSGTDMRIYQAAGEDELLAERKKIGIIQRGDAAVTAAFKLNARYIIHTVGPCWQGGGQNEAETLASCLRKSLQLAEGLQCESIAFPLISTGVYGFPKELALKIFTSVIYDHLMHSDLEVILVVYDAEAYRLSSKLFTEVTDYLPEKEEDPLSFEKAIEVKEISFHDYLIQLLTESNMSNPEIYRNANITKQHFSKIISNRDYLPGKNTICALAISLKLDENQLKSLLNKAGYSLSESMPFDLAVLYFIRNRMYHIVNDNIILFDNGLEQLGTIQ